MRIALFTDTYLPEINGLALTLRQWRIQMNAFGNSVRIIAPRYASEIETDESVLRVPSMSFPLYPSSRFALPGYRKLLADLRTFRPDIIHITTPFAIGLAGRKIAQALAIPCVVSYHTSFDRYLPFYGLTSFKNLIWDYMRWFHRPAQTIYAPTSRVKDLLIEQGIRPVEIWGRGIDTERFSPSKRSPDLRRHWNAEGKTVLLYVGRLAKEKRIDLILQTYRQLPADVREQARLVIVGMGPAEKELRRMAPSDVVFAGGLTGDDLATVYASADIFVLASETETFGNVILEAMASGLPVIAANAGGSAENIHHGQDGYLFAPGDLQEFAAWIGLLAKTKILRQAMAYQARKYVMRLTWPEIIRHLYLSYLQIIFDYEKKKRNIA